MDQRTQIRKIVERLVTNRKWDSGKNQYVVPDTTEINSLNTTVDESLFYKLRQSIKHSTERIYLAASELLDYLVKAKPPCQRIVAITIISHLFHRSRNFRLWFTDRIALFLQSFIASGQSYNTHQGHNRNNGANIKNNGDAIYMRKCLQFLKEWQNEFGHKLAPLRAAYAGLIAQGIKFPRMPTANTNNNTDTDTDTNNTNTATSSTNISGNSSSRQFQSKTDQKAHEIAYAQCQIQFNATEVLIFPFLIKANKLLDEVEELMAKLLPMVADLAQTNSKINSSPSKQVTRTDNVIKCKNHDRIVLDGHKKHALYDNNPVQRQAIISSDDDDSDDSDDSMSSNEGIDALADARQSKVVWEAVDGINDPKGTKPQPNLLTFTPNQKHSDCAATKTLQQLITYSDQDFARFIGMSSHNGEVDVNLSSSGRSPIGDKPEKTQTREKIKKMMGHIRQNIVPQIRKWGKLLQHLVQFEEDSNNTDSAIPASIMNHRNLLQRLTVTWKRLKSTRQRFKMFIAASNKKTARKRCSTDI